MEERKHYTREFKRDAVALTNQKGVSVVDVAIQIGVKAKLLYKWRRAFRDEGADAFPGTGNQTPEQAELSRLRKEVARLKNERDILKKAMRVIVGE